jgi:hypothetical protein
LVGLLVLGALALLTVRTLSHADAIVRTQAMLASTIAEYYVEEDRVRVELEIGLSDVQAFHNLMPDEIYQRLGNEPQPLRERIALFFEKDFVVVTDEGTPLPARILEMGPRERVKRDEITGEPLPAGEEEPETVIFASFEYALPSKPANLTLGGLVTSQASVGFVVYHKTIAVNEFRYLGPAQTLDLDWQDPWYSQFRTRNLRRAYYAPMYGFIYVEPYEVRKEIIVRPKNLQQWIDLGLAGRETIPVQLQDELKRKAAEFLRQHHRVTIDGQSVPAELAQINFLERTLRTSRVIDPPVELDLNAATLGAIFVYPTNGLPERVTMEWDLFDDRIKQVPAASVDQAGPLPTYLEPDFNVLEWQNFLTNPELPTLLSLAAPPSLLARSMTLVRWPLAAVGSVVMAWLLLGARRRGRSVRTRAAVAALAVVAAAGSFWLGRGARLSDEIAGEVVGGLLHNVYRAFDYREETQIYDVLEKSVAGELLTEIYLETRRGLELVNQGGARAKVKQIELMEIDARPVDRGGFLATAKWLVTGSVGHWGHVHQRRNQYRAELDVHPVDGAWKLTAIEILEEERL